jgi:hypothetical protein
MRLLKMILAIAVLGLAALATAQGTTERIPLEKGRTWVVDTDTGKVSIEEPVPRFAVAFNVSYSKQLKRFSLEGAATFEWMTFHNVMGFKGFNVEARALGAVNAETGLPNGGLWLLVRKQFADEAALLFGPKVVIDSDNAVSWGVIIGFELGRF